MDKVGRGAYIHSAYPDIPGFTASETQPLGTPDHPTPCRRAPTAIYGGMLKGEAESGIDLAQGKRDGLGLCMAVWAILHDFIGRRDSPQKILRCNIRTH
jgi:hypothetical protein